jgi:hypothetical protein
MATTAKPGDLAKTRKAYRRSLRSESMIAPFAVLAAVDLWWRA